MRRKETNPNAMFQPYRVAAEITGLSYKYIRDGCLKGEIPSIRVGADMRVNMPLFLEQLNRKSMRGADRTEAAE